MTLSLLYHQLKFLQACKVLHNFRSSVPVFIHCSPTRTFLRRLHITRYPQMSEVNMSEITSVGPYLLPAGGRLYPSMWYKPSLTTLVPTDLPRLWIQIHCGPLTQSGASPGLRSIRSMVQVMSGGPRTVCHMYVFWRKALHFFLI